MVVVRRSPFLFLLLQACTQAASQPDGRSDADPPDVASTTDAAPASDAGFAESGPPDSGFDPCGDTGGPDATSDTPICDCTLPDAVDLASTGNLVIEFTYKYTPRCVVVPAGTTITWQGNFLAHPLWPSACSGDVAQNPIHDVSDVSQTSLEIDFPVPGVFPYYCPNHANDGPSPEGMCGVVYVVP